MGDDNKLTLFGAENFSSEFLAEVAMYDALDFLLDFHYLDEMYIIEHILLLLENSVPNQVLPLHTDADGVVLTGFDPFSFRITVVLPGETERLANVQKKNNALFMKPPHRIYTRKSVG